MLDAVAQLSQYGVGYVSRILCHEVNTYTLAADQAHYLLYLIH